MSKSYDLVLMDIQMPVMDGHEATRLIRQRPEFATLPIVAVTAHAFAEERERCAASGMDDFLAKPMKPDALFELLDRWAPGATPGVDRAPLGLDGDPQEATGGAPTPPVDIDAFRAVMRDGGIEEIVEQTLELYARETPVVFERIRRAVENADAREVNAGAHMLKSSSANIRADGLAELLYRLESAGASGSLDEIAALMPDVESEYSSVMEYLTTAARA
jgi:response regulator RpfG family c-di-GMP phosphodiesterase